MGSLANTLDPDFPCYSVDTVPHKVSKAAMNMVGATYAVKYGKEGFKSLLPGPAQDEFQSGIVGHRGGA